jgi:hypothetical protein
MVLSLGTTAMVRAPWQNLVVAREQDREGAALRRRAADAEGLVALVGVDLSANAATDAAAAAAGR